MRKKDFKTTSPVLPVNESRGFNKLKNTGEKNWNDGDIYTMSVGDDEFILTLMSPIEGLGKMIISTSSFNSFTDTVAD